MVRPERTARRGALQGETIVAWGVAIGIALLVIRAAERSKLLQEVARRKGETASR